MKIVTLFLFCAIGVQSFGFELSLSKNFEQNIEPTTMQISFALRTAASSAEAVRGRFHSLVIEMKKSNVCSGGAYGISPEYRHEKNAARELIGFSGILNYTCDFEETSALDKAISLFSAQKTIELTQSPLRWVVKKEKLQETIDMLELKAVQHPKEYIKSLREQKIAECEISKISLNRNFYTPVVQNARVMSASIPEPTREAQEVQINAEYLYKCKEF